MEHDETGCQPHPEGPILCVNNCGFFGSAANMNMCSKCYKDMILKQEQAKLAASSIENLVNGSSSNEKGPVAIGSMDVHPSSVEVKDVSMPSSQASSSVNGAEPKAKKGPNRCSTCNKRVGLTGFKCRCGDLFCGSHRYSDKHDCPFDYRTAAQEAIAKANPIGYIMSFQILGSKAVKEKRGSVNQQQQKGRKAKAAVKAVRRSMSSSPAEPEMSYAMRMTAVARKQGWA
nr:zinc finger A20 and AN1 domain-containing stress-associated protein 8-like [Ipomoea batatas]